MRTNIFSKGSLAAALGSLLLIGAGCGASTQTTINVPSQEPDTQGDVKVNVNADMKVNLEAQGVTDARRTVDEAVQPIDDAGAREVQVTATNWTFEPKEIRAKAGEKIKLTLMNSDGTHGIAIPAFNVSLKPAPGTSDSTVFIADKKGTYPFFCNVRCGEGHREMKGTLIVE